MANKTKPKKTKRGLIKWIAVIIVAVALIGAVIGLAIKLDRQTVITRIGGESYSIGTLDETTGEYVEGDTAIYLRKGITTDGLKCEIADGAEITYQLFFYDKDGEFISATEQLSNDYSGIIPGGAETVKIMITPTADEDGKVSLVEVLGYASLLTVTVNR